MRVEKGLFELLYIPRVVSVKEIFNKPRLPVKRGTSVT
jgi:hypothetical protein